MLKKTFRTILLVLVVLSFTTLIKLDHQERTTNTIPINYPIKVSKTVQIEKPIGKIEIQKINLEKPLYSINSSHNNIEENVTILKESILPNKENSILFIAAHSGNSNISFFKDLDKIDVGDEVVINYQDNQYTYVVTDIYEQEKNGYISGIRNQKKQLILTTCCPNKEKCQLIINCIEKSLN